MRHDRSGKQQPGRHGAHCLYTKMHSKFLPGVNNTRTEPGTARFQLMKLTDAGNLKTRRAIETRNGGVRGPCSELASRACRKASRAVPICLVAQAHSISGASRSATVSRRRISRVVLPATSTSGGRTRVL